MQTTNLIGLTSFWKPQNYAGGYPAIYSMSYVLNCISICVQLLIRGGMVYAFKNVQLYLQSIYCT